MIESRAQPRASGWQASVRRSALVWLVMLPLVIIVLAPMWHMLVYAFVPEPEQFAWPFQWLPLAPTLENLASLLRNPEAPVAGWLLNTVIVTLGGTLAVVAISALTAFAFARLKFPGRDAIFFVMLVSIMVPTAVTLIPTFILLRDIKLLNTHVALWIPALANVGGVFLLRQQFFAIPRELEDAARVDGAGRMRIFLQICLPLVKPALMTLSILTFLLFWNDLLWPLIVISDRNLLTLTVGILFLSFREGIGVYFAAGLLSAVPALAFYLIFHKQIIEGVSAAGLSGR